MRQMIWRRQSSRLVWTACVPSGFDQPRYFARSYTVRVSRGMEYPHGIGMPARR